jgi:DNA-binding HxlR family transcriptional regulator
MLSMKTIRRRSLCPVSSALDLLGDRWTLLIVRDLVLRGPLTYGQFLESGERIATNILADRLATLTEVGIVEKREADVRSGYVYALTEKGLDLMPVLFELVLWGEKHFDISTVAPELGQRHRSDPDAFQAEARSRHESPQLQK